MSQRRTRVAGDPPAQAEIRALRPEIQALRAGAALLVVLFHLWPGRLPGGFVGVDVFFVISGFLITTHLAREASSTGRVRLARFWARRARRLLPAAYFVLGMSAIATLVWVPLSLWGQNLREIMASALYFQNWRLALDAVDYLAAENSPSVAQHYWTLSVEEQFYLAWPLLFVLVTWIAARRGARHLATATAVVAAVTAASFAYSLWLTYDNGAFAYFSTFTRAWQFGAGALLALVTLRAAERPRRARAMTSRQRAAMSWAGFLGLIWCGFAFDGSTAFPGTAALVPVIATVAVIVAGTSPSRAGPRLFIENRFVQWTGDISYPLYLWHWPPIVLVPIIVGHDIGFWPRVAILVGTFAAAAATKRYVEDPIRNGRRLGIRRTGVTFAAAALGAIALSAVSLGGIRHADTVAADAEQATSQVLASNPECFGAAAMAPGRPCNNPDLEGVLIPDTTAIKQDNANYDGCKATDQITRDCVWGAARSGRVPRVVVIGDSHARSLLPAFVDMAQAGRIVLVGHVKAGCPWSTNQRTGNDREAAEECYAWRESLNDYLKAEADQIDVIVTAALASDRQTGTPSSRVAGFARAWRKAADLDIPVVAVRDNPLHPTDPNLCLALEEEITSTSCALAKDSAFPNSDPQIEAQRQARGSRLYDFTDFYCGPAMCPAVIGGVNVYRDRSHLSKTFVQTLGPYIEARLDQDELLTRRER